MITTKDGYKPLLKTSMNSPIINILKAFGYLFALSSAVALVAISSYIISITNGGSNPKPWIEYFKDNVVSDKYNLTAGNALKIQADTISVQFDSTLGLNNNQLTIPSNSIGLDKLSLDVGNLFQNNSNSIQDLNNRLIGINISNINALIQQERSDINSLNGNLISTQNNLQSTTIQLTTKIQTVNITAQNTQSTISAIQTTVNNNDAKVTSISALTSTNVAQIIALQNQNTIQDQQIAQLKPNNATFANSLTPGSGILVNNGQVSVATDNVTIDVNPNTNLVEIANKTNYIRYNDPVGLFLSTRQLGQIQKDFTVQFDIQRTDFSKSYFTPNAQVAVTDATYGTITLQNGATDLVQGDLIIFTLSPWNNVAKSYGILQLSLGALESRNQNGDFVFVGINWSTQFDFTSNSVYIAGLVITNIDFPPNSSFDVSYQLL